MQSGLISLQVPSRASRRPHLSRNFSAKPALSWLARLRESVRDLCQLKDYSHFVGVSKATLHEAVQTVKGMLTQGVAYNKCRAACSGETSGGVLGKQEVRPSSTFHTCDTKLEAASQGRACTSAQLTLTNELSPGSAAAPPRAAAAARQVEEDAATNHGVVEQELEAGEQGAHHRLRSTARSHTLV